MSGSSSVTPAPLMSCQGRQCYRSNGWDCLTFVPAGSKNTSLHVVSHMPLPSYDDKCSHYAEQTCLRPTGSSRRVRTTQQLCNRPPCSLFHLLQPDNESASQVMTDDSYRRTSRQRGHWQRPQARLQWCGQERNGEQVGPGPTIHSLVQWGWNFPYS